MKTRRNYGATRGMTAGVLHPSTKDSSEKDFGKAGDLNDDVAGKEPQVLHETRAQKQTVKNGLEEDHAETAKDLSSAVVSETTSNSVGVATRSSTRPSKRLKLSIPRANKSGNQENKGEGNVGHETATSSSPQQRNRRKKKVKRQWESWGKEEKDTFFEAVHEYGKDFDKIRNFIATKHKRRGDPPSLIKNKDQVRHFYYRTLNKIAKYLPADKQNESDNHNKMVVELRGLICYGELRKKICGWHDKHGKKLHDLVSHGTTTIRYNGRNSKIKAPMCRALKRLTSAGQSKEDKDPQITAMPSKLVLELLPQDYAASAAVQRLAKNPRLRTTVPPKKSLSLMIDFLKQKWRVISTKSLEPLEICIVVPAKFYANSETADGQIDSPSTIGEESTSLMEVTPCADIAKDVSLLSSSGSVLEKCTAINGSGSNKMQATAPLELNDNDLGSVLHAQSVFSDKTNDQGNEMKETSTSEYLEPPLCSEVVMDSSLTPEPVREGNKSISWAEHTRPAFWTSESCGAITFGDIFYKLGKPPKLKLEYTWQDAESHLAPSQTAAALCKLVNIASVEYLKGRDSSEFLKPTSKSADVSLAKSTRVVQKDRATPSTIKERTTMSLPKEKVVPMITRVIPKPVEKLPFILPSVVPPALQTSASKAAITNLPTQKRLSARVRKRTRSTIQRTLLPRPVGSPSSVPPGAVAVSFIPQPGQTVGTILAAGASTSSVTTTTHSVTVSSATETSNDSELPAGEILAPSPEVVSEVDMNGDNSDHIQLDMSGFPETDQLLHVNWKALRDKDVTATSSVDSIIGLALGTALDVNETNAAIAVLDEDSNSDILASITGLKGSSITSQSVPASEVHIEELNYGIAGGVPSCVCSPTLESILNPSGATVQSPVSTTSSVFFSSTAPIASAVDSHIQHKDNESAPPMLLPQSVDSELNSTFPSFRTSSLGSEPQWLSGEASNFSLGSLLDKLTTSPRKEGKDVSIGDSSPNAIKETSQDALINPHHLLDADTALRAIMDENSVDYVRKFEDLAKEMAGNNSKTGVNACSTVTSSSIVSMESNGKQSHEGCSENLSFRSILRQNNMNGS